MAKGNTKFTARVKVAIESLLDDDKLDLVALQSRSLFSPVLHDGNYEWRKVMDSDGTLVDPRMVNSRERRDSFVNLFTKAKGSALIAP